jgi:hypothetical protein
MLSGRILQDGLSGQSLLLKLNTYEGRLLRQSQQLLNQFFALRAARARDLRPDDNEKNFASGTDGER